MARSKSKQTLLRRVRRTKLKQKRKKDRKRIAELKAAKAAQS